MIVLGKALGTAAVWGGIATCAYVFHIAGYLNAAGAGWMFVAGVVLNLFIWFDD